MEIIAAIVALLVCCVLAGLAGLALVHILTPKRKDPHAKRSPHN